MLESNPVICKHHSAINLGEPGMQKVFIYSISRIGTDDAYIGSSIGLRVRWKQHRYELNNRKHHCPALQEAWATYGPDAFAFSVLHTQTCQSLDERAALELGYILKLGTYNSLQGHIDARGFTQSGAAKTLASATMRARAENDPEYAAFLASRGAALAAFMKSPEGRANMAKHTKRRWQDPEERKRLRAGLDRKDPEVEARRAANIGKAHRTPEMKALHAANTAALWQDPEYREKVTHKAAKSRWGDPEAKARQAEKMRAYHAKRRGET